MLNGRSCPHSTRRKNSSINSRGVQDNILTDLGKVGDLKVISRSGVAPYRGKNRNMKQIGRDLGVANMLEGSVQISDHRVRINAKLINTQTAGARFLEIESALSVAAY